MNIIRRIQAKTPKWAAMTLTTINFVWLFIVAVQEAGIIDIFSFEPKLSSTIKGLTAIIVVIGNIFLTTRKQKQMPDYLELTEGERLAYPLTSKEIGLVVHQIDAQKGYYKVLPTLTWDYIGTRPNDRT